QVNNEEKISVGTAGSARRVPSTLSIQAPGGKKAPLRTYIANSDSGRMVSSMSSQASSVMVAHTQAAGTSRVKRLTKNLYALLRSADTTMTKPEITKKICTPAQPNGANTVQS